METTASPESYSPLKSASSWSRLHLGAHRRELLGDVGLELGLELEELARLRHLALEPLPALELARHARMLLRDAGRLGLVVPEAGAPMAASSSAARVVSASGSKVLTDPGKLGPELLELVGERDVDCVGHAPSAYRRSWSDSTDLGEPSRTRSKPAER